MDGIRRAKGGGHFIQDSYKAIFIMLEGGGGQNALFKIAVER